ncbi:hypothetical protein CYMTET_11383 [Cymbomonas tetramitiformis]|uniref:Uncharacterized protein n=1 Tax=Cymbomonas tetramitiformis TaxID=36881 RepID=A0AAE0GMD9_9CHLO|nr:hypothetical protein CYMTET_11383 [Cymbomonas tetramitiformis]
MKAAGAALHGDHCEAGGVQHATGATGSLQSCFCGHVIMIEPVPTWNALDLSVHGVSITALESFQRATEAIGAGVPVDTWWVDRWVLVFESDPEIGALGRSAALGAGWAFDPELTHMTGESCANDGFEHKVDELPKEERGHKEEGGHEEERGHRRVAPILENMASAVYGVGVVDKDHPIFEKVRVVHNYSENDEDSVSCATLCNRHIPEQTRPSAGGCDGLCEAAVLHD